MEDTIIFSKLSESGKFNLKEISTLDDATRESIRYRIISNHFLSIEISQNGDPYVIKKECGNEHTVAKIVLTSDYRVSLTDIMVWIRSLNIDMSQSETARMLAKEKSVKIDAGFITRYYRHGVQRKIETLEQMIDMIIYEKPYSAKEIVMKLRDRGVITDKREVNQYCYNNPKINASKDMPPKFTQLNTTITKERIDSILYSGDFISKEIEDFKGGDRSALKSIKIEGLRVNSQQKEVMINQMMDEDWFKERFYPFCVRTFFIFPKYSEIYKSAMCFSNRVNFGAYNHQNLEFFGDSVLSMYSSELIIKHQRNDPATCTNMRSKMVCNENLSNFYDNRGFYSITVGAPEDNKTKADLIEAFIGAFKLSLESEEYVKVIVKEIYDFTF